jgi:hypothetical protein
MSTHFCVIGLNLHPAIPSLKPSRLSNGIRNSIFTTLTKIDFFNEKSSGKRSEHLSGLSRARDQELNGGPLQPNTKASNLTSVYAVRKRALSGGASPGKPG